ncbi:hypothetical protein CCP3SC15_2160002 [Gammaproteobacteria bacterium]
MAKENVGTLNGAIVLEDRASKTVKDVTGGLGELKKQVMATALGFIGANGISQAIETVIGVTKELIKAQIEFQDTMAHVQARTGATTQELDVLGAGVKSLAVKYGRDAGGLAKALDQVAESGVEVRDSLDFLDTVVKASKIGTMEYGAAVDMLDTVLDSFNLTADKAPAVLDKLTRGAKVGEASLGAFGAAISEVSPLASEAGVSIDELIAAMATMTKGGVGIQQAAASLKLFMSAMEKPTKDLARAMGGDSLQAAGGFAKALKNIMQYSGGNIETISQLVPGARALSGVMKLAADGGNVLSDSLKNVKSSAGEADKQLKITEKTAQSWWDRFVQGIKHPLTTSEEDETVVDVLLRQYKEAAAQINAGKGSIGDYQTAIEELQRRLAMKWGTSMTETEQSYGNMGLIPTKPEDFAKMRTQIQQYSDAIVSAQKEAAHKIKSEALKNAPSLTPGAKPGETPADRDARLAREAAAAKKAAKDAEDLEKKRIENLKEFAALEASIMERTFNAKSASLKEQAELYDEESQNEKRTVEERLQAVIKASQSRMALAAVEANYLMEQAAAKRDLQEQEFKGQKDKLAEVEAEYKATSAEIEANWEGVVSKQLRIKAEASITLNQSVWDRLQANIHANFNKWADDLENGSTTAWSGLVTDVTGGITDIGTAFGGMNDRWAKSINDLGGLMNAVMSGNPIAAAISGFKFIGDAIFGAGEKSKIAAEEERKAAVEANKAAQSFLKASGRDDITTHSFEVLQDDLETANNAFLDYLKGVTGATSMQDYQSSQQLDTISTEKAIKDLNKKADDARTYHSRSHTYSETTESKKLRAEAKELQRLLNIKAKSAWNQPTISQFTGTISDIESEMATRNPDYQPTIIDTTRFTGAKAALDIAKSKGQLSEWDYWDQLGKEVDKHWKEMDPLEIENWREQVKEGKANASSTPPSADPSTPAPYEPEPLAEGGIVTRPTLAMIGEGGESEIVAPLSKLGEIMNQLHGFGGSGDLNINVHVSGETESALEVGNILGDRLETMFRAKGRS